MYAEIVDGVLRVVPENSTEEWALKVWEDKSLVYIEDFTRKEDRYFRGSLIRIATQMYGV